MSDHVSYNQTERCYHGATAEACKDCKYMSLLKAATLTIEPEVGQQTDTPLYYKQNDTDLYDLLITHYGLDSWQKHVEMEVIQYLWRCRHKGDYVDDITKAKVILERILSEHESTLG